MSMCVIDVDMAACMLWLRFWVDIMEMSFAYEIRCSGAGGCGMSDVYMLKSVGERTPP